MIAYSCRGQATASSDANTAAALTIRHQPGRRASPDALQERSHPGAQLRFTDIGGHRVTFVATSTNNGQFFLVLVRDIRSHYRLPGHQMTTRHRSAEPGRQAWAHGRWPDEPAARRADRPLRFCQCRRVRHRHLCELSLNPPDSPSDQVHFARCTPRLALEREVASMPSATSGAAIPRHSQFFNGLVQGQVFTCARSSPYVFLETPAQ
jgi:hypothetical protein